MAIEIQKDIWKLSFGRRNGTLWMIGAGLILMFFIIANILWIGNYNVAEIEQVIINQGKNPTLALMNGYVRFKVIIAVLTNTAVMGLFAGLVWWGLEKKRYGFGFGISWLVIFGANAISLPFYTVQIDWSSIVSAILYFGLTIGLVIWNMRLLQHRTKMRVLLARKGDNR